MTQEKKNLLITDLSARLMHGVKCEVRHKTVEGYKTDIMTLGGVFTYQCYFVDDKGSAYSNEFKPYLRPMSSMTEEERGEYNIIKCSICPDDADDYAGFVDWLNSHHFDYRGLIELDLALEAPEGMYNF